MAVTMPAKSVWGDDLANLTQMVGIGTKFLNAAPIFQLFGSPVQVSPGQLRFKWGGDAVAGIAATTSGTPYTTTVGSVATAFTKDFAAVVGSAVKSYDVSVNTSDNGTAADQSSMDLALAAMYDLWVTGLVGSGDGTDHAVWGAGNAVAAEDTALGSAIMTISGSYTSAQYDADQSLIFDAVDDATSEMSYGLGADGYFICLSDKVFFQNIKKQLRKMPGTNPSDIAMENFGPNFLMYDGIVYAHHKALTAANDESTAFLFKVGTNGVSNYAPAGVDLFKTEGPIITKGELDKEQRIILNCQVGYNSPRSVAKLTQIAK